MGTVTTIRQSDNASDGGAFSKQFAMLLLSISGDVMTLAAGVALVAGSIRLAGVMLCGVGIARMASWWFWAVNNAKPRE